MLCLRNIVKHRVAQNVPLEGEVSYAEVAESIGLDEHMLKRFIRHAITLRVFSEPRKGFVAHTPVSRLLLDPHVWNWEKTGAEEMWPAAVFVCGLNTEE